MKKAQIIHQTFLACLRVHVKKRFQQHMVNYNYTYTLQGCLLTLYKMHLQVFYTSQHPDAQQTETVKNRDDLILNPSNIPYMTLV